MKQITLTWRVVYFHFTNSEILLVVELNHHISTPDWPITPQIEGTNMMILSIGTNIRISIVRSRTSWLCVCDNDIVVLESVTCCQKKLY